MKSKYVTKTDNIEKYIKFDINFIFYWEKLAGFMITWSNFRPFIKNSGFFFSQVWENIGGIHHFSQILSLEKKKNYNIYTVNNKKLRIMDLVVFLSSTIELVLFYSLEMKKIK